MINIIVPDELQKEAKDALLNAGLALTFVPGGKVVVGQPKLPKLQSHNVVRLRTVSGPAVARVINNDGPGAA